MNKKFNSILILLTIFHTLAFPTDNGNNNFLGASFFVTTVAATIGVQYINKNNFKASTNRPVLPKKLQEEIKTATTKSMIKLINPTNANLSKSSSNQNLTLENSSGKNKNLANTRTFENVLDENLLSNLFSQNNSTNEIQNSDEEVRTISNIETTTNADQEHSPTQPSSPTASTRTSRTNSIDSNNPGNQFTNSQATNPALTTLTTNNINSQENNNPNFTPQNRSKNVESTLAYKSQQTTTQSNSSNFNNFALCIINKFNQNLLRPDDPVYNNLPLLYWAAFYNDIQLSKTLLTVYQANPDFYCDHNHNTLLHFAVENNNFNLTKILLENNAEPKTPNLFRQTPLSIAQKILGSRGHSQESYQNIINIINLLNHHITNNYYRR